MQVVYKFYRRLHVFNQPPSRGRTYTQFALLTHASSQSCRVCADGTVDCVRLPDGSLKFTLQASVYDAPLAMVFGSDARA